MKDSPRPVSAETIANLRQKGVSFDVMVVMFVDLVEVAQTLTIQRITGHLSEGFLDPVQKLALMVMAYYSPELLGIEIDEFQEEE